MSSEEEFKKRLTDAEYEQAKTLYELGAKSLQDIADMFGVSRQTLWRKFKDNGVERGSRAHETTEVIEDEIAKQAEILAKRVTETRENHYVYADTLAKLVMTTIMKTRQEGRSIATADGELAALNKAIKGLEVLRKERYSLLGLDRDDGDPNEEPELLISEMTDDMIEAVRAGLSTQADNLDGIDELLDSIEIVDETEIDQ